MILDEVLPRFDYRESYSIFVAGTSRERAYEVVRRFDFGGSLVVRLLLRLRGMPAVSVSPDGLTRAGFIPLADAPPGEIVMGVAGRFWNVAQRPLRMSADDFMLCLSNQGRRGRRSTF